MARRPRRDRPDPQWSQQKMRALLAAGAITGLLLLIGLADTCVHALHGGTAPAGHSTSGTARGLSSAASLRPPAPTPGAPATGTGVPATDVASREDALAGAPMPAADDDAAHPGPVSTRDPGPALPVPKATGTGSAGVPTGYLQTPAGALAQLAAIDVTAVQSGSLSGARTVIAGWAAAGGPTGESWSVVTALAQLFTSAGVSGAGSPQLALVLTPEMGRIKGTVGNTFAVPCVDFELDVTVTQTARGAVADCQRMTWTGTRWMIAAGSEAAQPPAVWADTDTAISLGWQDLSHA